MFFLKMANTPEAKSSLPEMEWNHPTLFIATSTNLKQGWGSVF